MMSTKGSYTIDFWTCYMACKAFGRFFLTHYRQCSLSTTEAQPQHSVYSWPEQSAVVKAHCWPTSWPTSCATNRSRFLFLIQLWPNSVIGNVHRKAVLPLCSQLLPCLPSCLTSQLEKHPRKAGTAVPSDFCRSKGSRSSFALKLWSHHCNTARMQNIFQEQQNSIQCTAPSDASVLQGNCPVTRHTRLKCAKTCESYFSSIIVERYLLSI